ncbi:MAG: LamG domain-containing protein, partial [Anaerolineaceae bacterium]
MGYWTLDSISNYTVADSSGRSHPGTVTGSVTSFVNAHLGSALSFDGSTAFITVPNSSDFSPSGSFSISAWINPQEIVANRNTRIFEKTGAYSLIINTTGQLQFRVEGLTPAYVNGPSLPINQWTFVTAIYDSTLTQLRLYFNGEMISVVSVTGSNVVNSNTIYFGSSVPTERYYGRLDEIRFYNRALTNSEIQTLFGSSLATSTPTIENTLTPIFTSTSSPAINVALNKPLSSSGSISNPSAINNGDKNSSNYSSLGNGIQWVQIDFGQIYNINQIKLWHYF